MIGKTERKTVDYYLSLNYRIALSRDEDGDYLAEVEGLPGCVADGRTPTEAYSNIYSAMRAWIESRLDAGLDIYEPDAEPVAYSGRILLRIPRYLHRALANRAKAERVSLNQYLVSQLAESNGANRQLHSSPGALSELERSYDMTLEALYETFFCKAPESASHSKLVTTYAIALCRAMDLSSDVTQIVARSAFLHDIGMMAVPDSILLKPTRLSREEKTVLEQHCVRGFEILSHIPFLRDVAQIVYSHHEKFDGSGYPRGLKGEAIPLGSRVIAVADALAVMTSDRAHAPAKSVPQALQEIKQCSKSQFDSKVVEALLSMPQSLWLELRRALQESALVSSPFREYVEKVSELALAAA